MISRLRDRSENSEVSASNFKGRMTMAHRDVHNWRHFYQRALRETDAQELQGSIMRAEEAIFLRLSRQQESERDDLQSALCHLQLIKSVSACFVTESEWAEQPVACVTAQRGV
jgi:hypothetical protein